MVFALLCAVQTLLAANKQAETFNMQKAYEAFQNQDYQTAVDCLNKELADDAKNGYAYLWMAIAYTTVDDYGSMLTNSDKDFMGSSSYLTASGDIIEGSVVNLRNVNFGGLDMNNVKATVVKTQNAPILLGQSVLSRLGKVEIDYSSNTIRITRKVKTTR